MTQKHQHHLKDQKSRELQDNIKQIENNIRQRLEQVIKEPPKWIPRKVWFKFAKIFLNL